MSVATSTAIAITAGVSAAGAIGGGVLAKKGADNQAKAALSAADANSKLQWKMFNQNRTDQLPWIKAGQGAVSNLAGLVGPGGELSKDFTAADFQKDPGYDFRLAEGQKALERSAASKGNLFGGGTLKALDRYNQNFASNEFENAYNRFQSNRQTRYNQLAGLAGLGQNSAQGVGEAGQNAATNIGNVNFEGQTQAANAQAAGLGAIGQTIGNLGNMPMNWYMLSQLSKGGSGGGGWSPF